MLCAKCQKQNATVHYTIIDGAKFEKVDLCVECALPILREEKSLQVKKIRSLFKLTPEKPGSWAKQLPRMEENISYPIEAYEFVSEALDFCAGEASGREVLDAIGELAIRKFGRQSKAVLRGWKILRTEDFGEIVFTLIDTEKMRKRFRVSREDFQNGFNFDDAFPEK